MEEKTVYRNIGDGSKLTPIPREVVEYFNREYAGKRVPLNADRCNAIAEILRKQGIDV